METLSVIADFIEAPGEAARRTRESPSISAALLAFLAAGTSVFLAQAVAGRGGTFWSLWVSWAIACLWHLVSGAAMTSFLHLSAEAVGGRGRVLSLFVLVGLSDLGWALALPAVLIARVFFPEASWPSWILLPLAGFLVLSLRARSISHNYGLGMARSWVAVSIPYVGAALMVVAFTSLAVFGLVSRLMRMAG
ncbi:MAG: hypothetical protein AAB576_04055 [Elusimicrobiota bacterium]